MAIARLSPHQSWLDQQPETSTDLAPGIVYVQHPAGHYQFAPLTYTPCPHCSGSGIILDEELQLEGLCPECGGYGEVS